MKRAIYIEEFKALNQDQQLDLIHKEGVHIGKKNTSGKTAILYQLNDFYVEVIYKSYRREVEAIKLFSDTASIQFYLDQVPVRDLDNNKNP
jgi:hypothetical protein